MSKRAYDIAFVGLAQGTHLFNYELNDTFFAEYGEVPFKNCNATVQLSIIKNSSFLQLHFAVGGTATTLCDRCGNDYPLQLWDEFKIVVKMAHNPQQMNDEEKDPDIYYISYTDSILVVKDWLYEFVLLSIPMQSMCSEQQIGAQCNQTVISMLQTLSPDTEHKKAVWKDLDKFKNLDN